MVTLKSYIALLKLGFRLFSKEYLCFLEESFLKHLIASPVDIESEHDVNKLPNELPLLWNSLTIILNLDQYLIYEPCFDFLTDLRFQVIESTQPKWGFVRVFILDQNCPLQVMKDILDTLHLEAYVEPEEAETLQKAYMVRDQLACIEISYLSFNMKAQFNIELIHYMCAIA